MSSHHLTALRASLIQGAFNVRLTTWQPAIRLTMSRPEPSWPAARMTPGKPGSGPMKGRPSGAERKGRRRGKQRGEETSIREDIGTHATGERGGP